MKKKSYFIISLILLCTSVYFGGCNHSASENKKSVETEAVSMPEGPSAVTREITKETDENKKTDIVSDEKVIDELNKDIDNNGVMDSIQLLERNDGTVYLNVSFDGETIFTYEHEELRLSSIGSFEYLDLDQDLGNEIFITVYPSVNSMPLIDVIALKQSEGKWNMMGIPLNEEGFNCFPLTVTRGDKEFDFIISSKLTDKQAHFDASSYYVDEKGNNVNSIQSYRNRLFVKGDIVGYVSSWGIWEAQTGTYEGRNCIIAEHGLNGDSGKFNYLGRVDIYYAYDKDGNIEILDLVHKDI